jgi:6-phosphogluconate dehydrogenase
MSKSNLGLIGFAVMGENLVLNMESKGFRVAVYNRTTAVPDKFAENRAKGKTSFPAGRWRSLWALSRALGKSRSW